MIPSDACDWRIADGVEVAFGVKDYVRYDVEAGEAIDV